VDAALLSKIHTATLDEVSETSDFEKVVASVPVFVALLSVDSLRDDAVGSVLLLLTHPWPRIRTLTAQQFFEFVIANNSFVDDENFEALTEILSVTPWDSDLSLAAEGVESLCQLLQVAKPTRQLNSTIQESQDTQTDYGYDALVNEVGY